MKFNGEIVCIVPREKSKYETQIEKVVKMVQKKDREISSLKQVSYKCGEGSFHF